MADNRKDQNETQNEATTSAASASVSDNADTSIHPFTIAIPQAELDDLHARLAQTRWPATLPGAAWSRGVPVEYLQGLAEYWRSGYDWRAQEAQLNEFPQFTTEIDGQTIHFLHVRSPEPNALPLIITHGYPGSVAEFMKIIGPLTNPRTYGGDPADAFHVVAPSLPGFGFSVPVREAGWETSRTARAWAELMRRLGYERYGAQGGDVGSGVSGLLGGLDPDHVVGIHINSDFGAAVAMTILPFFDPAGLASLSEDDKARLQRLQQAREDGVGYIKIQSTRPQTIAYGLNDSPAAQLAWIAEKFKEWTDKTAELPEDAVDRDQLLTNISLYWFTGTGTTAANFLYEAAHAMPNWGAPSTAPVGWAVFASDPMVRPLMDPQRKIAHWSEFERGGHFAAMEQPDLLVGDIREFFRSLR